MVLIHLVLLHANKQRHTEHAEVLGESPDCWAGVQHVAAHDTASLALQSSTTCKFTFVLNSII